MELFKLHVFTSFVIAIVFFIAKIMIKRIYKDEKIQNKNVLKDSIIVFGVSYLTHIVKDNLITLDNIKTQVFTNEPSF